MFEENWQPPTWALAIWRGDLKISPWEFSKDFCKFENNTIH